MGTLHATPYKGSKMVVSFFLSRGYRFIPLSKFLYVDGHQRIYFGSKANLPSKYISRQKLCLAATTEYWVNDPSGLPVLVVTGELTEKLEQAIEEMIIPELEQTSVMSQIL